MNRFARSEMLIGQENMDKLKNAAIAVFGVGGVGSFVTEALARSGIGKIFVIDYDDIDQTNINRQLPALDSTIGMAKVDVIKRRIYDINPNCEVYALKKVYEPGKGQELIASDLTYIVDAIDSVAAKVDLISSAISMNIPIISSMGTGNKLDPSKLTLTDISKTHTCPLARVVRKLLKEKGITTGLKVIFSTEKPSRFVEGRVPASMIFVPASAGLHIASAIVRDIIDS